MKFLLASLKTLTKSKNYSESRIKFLFRLSFALIGKIFQCTFSRSQAGYGTNFRDKEAIRRLEQAL
jgi:hypothetical protein